MESKSFEEVLTKPQLRQLKAFIKAHKGQSPTSLTVELKELMKPWDEELERKGILSDYLAYYTSYLWSRTGDDAMLDAIKMAQKRLGEVV